MKFFEDNIENRFKEGTSLDGINPEELWNEIEANLPPAQAVPSYKRFRKLLLLLLLFITASFLWYQLSETEKQADAISTSKEQSNTPTSINNAYNQTEAYDAESKNNIPSEINKRKEFVNSKEKAKENATEKHKSSNAKASQFSLQKNNILSKKEVPLSPKLKPQNNTQEKELEHKTILDNLVEEETNFKEKKEQKSTINSTEKANQPTIPAMKKIAIRQSFVLGKEEEQLQWKTAIDPLQNVPALKDRKFSIGVFSGLNFWDNKFEKGTELNSTGQLLENANEKELGHSIAMEVNWKFHKNLYLLSGIGYSKTWNEFNIVQTWDTTMFRNNIPGGDLINASAERTVKHHNAQQFFSLPIMLGTSKRLGHLDFGLNAGLSLNYFIKQNGKSLNFNNRITEYPVIGTQELPYSKFFLSFQIQPYIQYQATKDLAFQLRPDIRYQSHGNSKLFDLKHSSLLTGLSFGLIFTP